MAKKKRRRMSAEAVAWQRRSLRLENRVRDYAQQLSEERWLRREAERARDTLANAANVVADMLTAERGPVLETTATTVASMLRVLAAQHGAEAPKVRNHGG